MSLADALSTPPPSRRAAELCIVGRILEQYLSSEDRAALQAALDDPRWPASDLTALLKAEGFAASDTSVLRHRKARCACGAR